MKLLGNIIKLLLEVAEGVFFYYHWIYILYFLQLILYFRHFRVVLKSSKWDK